MREEAELWFKQAKDDLKYAEVNLKEGIFYVCAFLSQQAAEKALKALYIETKREMPAKTHNLVTLGKALNVPENIAMSLREINPDFVTTRYPDAANGLPSEIFDLNIATEHLDKAKEVVLWVEEQIS